MKLLKRFWNQPSARYRNFQIVFTILTLNFAVPTISYVFAPETAQEQFARLNELLGGSAYTFPEAQSRFWRYLGAANVATLALMCGLLQWNLRRNFPTLTPLIFMKSLAATLWLAGYLASPEYPAFLAAAALDFVTSALFAWFALRAHRDVEDLNDEALIPPPSPIARWNEQVGDTVLRAVLPVEPGLAEVARGRLERPHGRSLRIGFWLAVWAISLAPLLVEYRRPFWRLELSEREALIRRLASSKSWWVRQIIQIVKLVACFSQYARTTPLRSSAP